MSNSETQWRLAACYRATSLALVVFVGAEVAYVERHRFDTGPESPTVLRPLLAALATSYNVAALVVEPDSLLAEAAKRLNRPVQPVTLPEAKHVMLGSGRHTVRALCRHLTLCEPKLRRFARLLPSGEVAMSDPRRTTTFLAVAIGLAAIRQSDNASSGRQ